jgi:pilus assembly protein TadC
VDRCDHRQGDDVMWATVLCVATALITLPSVAGGLHRLAPEGRAVADAVDAPPPDPLAVATTFDLLAACLRSGLPISTAAAAAAQSAPTSFGVALRKAADLLELGADAATAWDAVAQDPETEALARMARRSARAGSSMASAMTELAATQRTRAEDASAAAAERAGVLISGPLGLCFLPAFICLGIIPVVIGLAGNVLGGGLL